METTEVLDLARECIAPYRIEDVVINESTSLEFLYKSIRHAALRVIDSAADAGDSGVAVQEDVEKGRGGGRK